MKNLFLILCAALLSGIAVAQTVTINVTGNRNKQISVDGRSYTISNSTTLEDQDVVINDLSTGQHTLQVVRTNPNNNRTTTTTTSFNLREGYDLDIKVSGNGAVSQTERRSGRPNIGTAISAANFNKIYTATRNRTTSSSRAAYLQTEFDRTNRWFTSSQLSQLIKLVNTESLRLQLAKQSYTKVTDPQNFSLVSNLLISSSNRQALQDYIASIPELGDGEDVADGEPMTNERFNAIYKEAFGIYSSTEKNIYLTNLFNKDYNFYSSSQARQLIQLVPTEAERFQLAKLSYRGITDRENFDEVIQLLNSSYNRSQLSAYIATYDQGNPVLAMSSAEFNNLYNTISRQSSTNRYSSINTAFTTSGDYFTTAQAKQLIQLVSNEANRLQLSKTVYRVLTDRANYTALYDVLSSQASRNDLANYVYSFNNYNTGSGMAMSDAEFNQLRNTISGTWSTTSRYNQVYNAFQSSLNYFSASQARQLLLLINSESDRLALAKNAYDNLADPGNYAVMSDLFASSANRNEWTRYASQYSGGIAVKTPMADTEFDNMYRDVQFTFGIGAKMSRLTDIFNNESNYFTVDQAKRLIQLVSAESNRLELSKLAYHNLTDPANYTALYSILSSQTSRDELSAWVGANASIR